MSGRRYSSCALVGIALLLTTPILLVDHGGHRHDAPPAGAPAADPELEADPLRGLWTRYASRAEGAPLRFWYFHGDGKGLYRYGRVGLANTHSFDYEVEGGGDELELGLRFRKRGEAHELRAVIERDAEGQTWLVLRGDPREPGARYRRVESSLDFTALARANPSSSEEQTEPAAAGLGDRIWIDYRNFATGGSGFHMYQLAKTAIDGRGVGWFHSGDFDDWSTESLTYRIDGDRLELFFDLREEPNSTRFRIVGTGEGRELVLDEDPRDFWAAHRYRDGGRSFASGAFDAVIGLQRYLEAP